MTVKKAAVERIYASSLEEVLAIMEQRHPGFKRVKCVLCKGDDPHCLGCSPEGVSTKGTRQ
jgi:hypothetical protein